MEKDNSDISSEVETGLSQIQQSLAEMEQELDDMFSFEPASEEKVKAISKGLK